MRLGERCHMIGSPSGELLKKPQQSGQGQALMPKEKREVCKCVHVEECTNREELEEVECGRREGGRSIRSTCSAVLGP